MKLEMLGKVLALGFGDRVLIGILFGFVDNVTPMRMYEYIRDNQQLGYWLSGADWEKYKGMVKKTPIPIDDFTYENAVKELKKRRPDLLGVIINIPNGENWLRGQIVELKRKLGLVE